METIGQRTHKCLALLTFPNLVFIKEGKQVENKLVLVLLLCEYHHLVLQ